MFRKLIWIILRILIRKLTDLILRVTEIMKNILICNLFKPYTLRSIVSAFNNYGYRVEQRDYFTPEDIYHDDKLERILERDVRSAHYDFVFTVNYNPIISNVCHKNNTKYVSWTYDTPMNLRSTETMDNPNNYIFIFDNGEYQKYKKIGLDTVYYLPLATNFGTHIEENSDYEYDITFLGNLYRSTFPSIKEKLDKYHAGFLDGIVSAQRGLYGCYIVLNLLKEQKEEVKTINEITGFDLIPEQLSYSIASYITYLDRLSLLSIMSNRFNTALATGNLEKEERSLMPKLKVLPGMDYYDEMPFLFRKTKINLNPPFRAMWSAIPQRALDIMSSGGFLLSGYTEELSYYFENGRELVLYDSIEDAVAKAEFYLKNDDLREEIRKAGAAKVNTDFTYEGRLQEILEIIGLL